MHTALLLKIAAIVALIQYGSHAVLFLRAKPSHGQDEVDLVSAMRSRRWSFNGFERSYWDFYFGYGLLVILWGVVEIVLLWLLAALANLAVPITAIVMLLLVANIAHGILALRYFFLVPAIFDLLVVIPLFLALLR